MASAVPPPPHERIRYRRSDEFAICRLCFTHLALIGLREGESQNTVLFQDQWFLFEDAVNLRLDQEHEITDGAKTVRAYCNDCGSHLGFKMISLPVQDDILREGRYFLDGSKMNLWYDNKLWFGHTPTVEIDFRVIAAIVVYLLNFRT